MASIDVWLGLGAVVVLILVNAFFVLCEFSLVSVDRAAVRRRAERGDRAAAATQAVLAQLTLHLSGIQLAVTAISLLLGYIAEPAIGRAVSPLISWGGLAPGTRAAIAAGIGLALATCAQMVVGELIPKNWAVAKPLEVSRAVIVPLRAYVTIFRPLIRLLTAAANLVVRAFGVTPRAELVAVRSTEELRLLIESSRAEGRIPETESSLLARALSFRSKRAEDAMVPRTAVHGLAVAASLADLAAAALATGHSRFPVYEGDIDKVVGVVHVKDTYSFPPPERPRVPVQRVMTAPLLVPESRSLGSLLADMRRERIQMAVVLDEFGGTAGIVTIEDILEEIVGDIEDEYDPGQRQELVTPAGGIHLLSGMLHRDEVAEACGLELPPGDFETLGGFVLDLLGHIPQQGEHAVYRGWELKVVEMDGNRVSQVLLVAPQPAQREDA